MGLVVLLKIFFKELKWLKFSLALIIIFCAPTKIIAEDVTSTNFTIFTNGINSGGGRTTSSNFILESTIGEISGVTTSTNFSDRAGFQAVSAEARMTMVISANSVSLGELTTSAVSYGSVVLTVTTNASSGYSVTMTEDGNLRSAGANDIDDVIDGSVAAGSEEYGIRTSGSAGQFNSSDAGISGSMVVVSNSSAASAEQTTVSFRASVSNATYNGSYSHTVTFSTVANF